VPPPRLPPSPTRRSRPGPRGSGRWAWPATRAEVAADVFHGAGDPALARPCWRCWPPVCPAVNVPCSPSAPASRPIRAGRGGVWPRARTANSHLSHPHPDELARPPCEPRIPAAADQLVTSTTGGRARTFPAVAAQTRPRPDPRRSAGELGSRPACRTTSTPFDWTDPGPRGGTPAPRPPHARAGFDVSLHLRTPGPRFDALPAYRFLKLERLAGRGVLTPSTASPIAHPCGMSRRLPARRLNPAGSRSRCSACVWRVPLLHEPARTGSGVSSAAAFRPYSRASSGAR